MKTTTGQILRSSRVKKGLNLSEAATAAGVPATKLQALEEDNLSLFDASVYAQGAFNKYIQFLGIDSVSLRHQFQRLLHDKYEQPQVSVPKRSSWLASRLTPRLVLAVAISFIAFLVLLYLLVQAVGFFVLPDLVLDQPSFSLTTEKRTAVAGSADPLAVVTVNNEQVVVGEDGHFVTEIMLQAGVNVIQVEATNAAGRSRQVVKHLLVTD